MMSERQILHAELKTELQALRIVILSRVFARKGITMLVSHFDVLREHYDLGEIGTSVMLGLKRNAVNLWRDTWRSALDLIPTWR